MHNERVAIFLVIADVFFFFSLVVTYLDEIFNGKGSMNVDNRSTLTEHRQVIDYFAGR